MRDCLRSQMDGSDEEQVVEARQQLNHAYDRVCGALWPGQSSRQPTRLRRRSRFAVAPLAGELQRRNQAGDQGHDFPRADDSSPASPSNRSATPKEALLVSLNEHGRVDLDHMAGLLNKPAEEFLPDLKGIIFLNPQTNQWETDDQYLSGNVREKLAVADAAAVTDARFHENVEALKSVQPEDLPGDGN